MKRAKEAGSLFLTLTIMLSGIGITIVCAAESEAPVVNGAFESQEITNGEDGKTLNFRDFEVEVTSSKPFVKGFDYCSSELVIGACEELISNSGIYIETEFNQRITPSNVEKHGDLYELKLPVPLSPDGVYTLVFDAENAEVKIDFTPEGINGAIIKRIKLADYGGYPVTKTENGDEDCVCAQIFNPCRRTLHCAVYAAVYENNQLVEVASKDVDLEAFETGAAQIPVTLDDTRQIKIMVFDKERLSPLGYAYSPSDILSQTQQKEDFYLAYDPLSDLYFNDGLSQPWSGEELFNSVAHGEDGALRPSLSDSTGKAWTGEGDWYDYIASANVSISSQNPGGTFMLAVRHTDTRYYGSGYYAAGFKNGNSAVIMKYTPSPNGQPIESVLCSKAFDSAGWSGVLSVKAADNEICLYADEKLLLSYIDNESTLSVGNAGIIAEDATAVVTDFRVVGIYDSNGGSADNFLRGAWDYDAAVLLNEEELDTVCENSFGEYYYPMPQLALDMSKLENLIPCSGFEIKDEQDGLHISGGKLSGDFTVEFVAEKEERLEIYKESNQNLSIALEKDLMNVCIDGVVNKILLTDYPDRRKHFVFAYDGEALSIYCNSVLLDRISCAVDVSDFRLRTDKSLLLLRLYDFALSDYYVTMRYGMEGGDSALPMPIEKPDFSRYVYKTMPIIENGAIDGDKIIICDDFLAKKEYERTVYGKNVFFLNTISSARKMGFFIGDFGDASKYKNLDELTAVMWVNISSPRNGQYHRLISYGNEDRTQFGFEISFVNETMFVNGSEFTQSDSVKKRSEVDMADYVNRWCQLVFTRRYNIADGSWNFSVYADGRLLLERKVRSERVDEKAMRLGICSQPNGANCFWGYLGEAEIYNQYFDAAMVRNSYKNGILTYRSARINK